MPTITHGVASFDPTSTGILLWSRVLGADEVLWRVATDPAFADVVAHGTVAVDAAADSTVVVDVDGLSAATTYFYDVAAGGVRSPVGRTRTLPADRSAVRLGLVSCARYSVAPLGVYRALAEREVDLVVHLGDYIYEDDGAKGSRTHEPPHTAVTLDDYRRRIAQVRRDPDCLALHLRHPMVLILDDHDVADNCWATGAKAHDPAEHGEWTERVRAATQARQEWLPARLTEPADPTRVWRSLALGGSAELVLLDTRLAGREQHAGDEGTRSREDPERSLLGGPQRAWLDERLDDVTRPWSIVVSGVVVNEISLPLPATRLLNPLLPNGYAATDGQVIHDDQWDGYTAERDHLVERLARRGALGGRALLLSGDVHTSWAFEGPRTEDGTPVAVEVTAPSAASAPMGRSRVPGYWRLLDAVIRRLEHAPWVDVSSRGYSLIEVAPGSVTAEWWFVEATDEDPTAGAERARTLVTHRATWPPRWEDAPPLIDAERPGADEPPPLRPDDLPHLRRAHHRRQLVARSLGVAVTATVAGLASRLLRRR